MITLYGFGPGFGLPEISPYVTKTEVQLKMAGLDYRKQRTMPADAPKGQLPWIEDGGERIGDSTFIRAHLERRHGVDFDEGLTSRQRAAAWALERMLENHLGWAIGYERWLTPANFEKGPAHFFDGAPDPEGARQEVLERVTAAMRAVGVARHAPEDVVWLGERSLQALSELLGEGPYLFGERPCGTDATAFAMVAAAITPFFASGLGARARARPNLVAYADRMMERFYPAFAWSRAAA